MNSIGKTFFLLNEFLRGRIEICPAEEEENEYFQEDSQNRNTKFYDPKYQKRARTLSPGAKKRSLNAHKTSRRSARQGKWEQEKQARREQRESQFLREVLSEVPIPEADTNSKF